MTLILTKKYLFWQDPFQFINRGGEGLTQIKTLNCCFVFLFILFQMRVGGPNQNMMICTTFKGFILLNSFKIVYILGNTSRGGEGD